MKYDHWEIASPAAAPVAALPELVGMVLAARGIVDEGDARAFLRTDLGLLHDPMALKDLDRAVARLETAFARGETVAVYGDYDVDGVTATCLLYDFFCQKTGVEKVLWHIPRRMEDGYGLSRAGLESLKERGAQLVVTVDCGITAVDEVEYAKSLGLEVIITDHHSCKDTLPDAVAVVDPHRTDCPYPFKGLAGVGVALKLAMAMGAEFEDYADLAALGTVADVMPVLDENRAIITQGLEKINRQGRPGIRALLEASGNTGKVSATTLGYTLAPRINAAGRLGVTEISMALMLSRSMEEAEPLAQELCQLNRQRQALEGDIFQLCAQRVEAEMGEDAAIVIAGEDWHQGVVGIVASRLAEQYSRPAFVISLKDGMGKGSCRGVGGVSLFEALESAADLLEGFGGHAMAAGFTVKEENIPALREKLNAWIAQESERVFPALLEVDVVLEDPSLLTVENVEALDMLEPFGAGNPKPVFVLPRATLVSMDRVGAEEKHMRLRLRCRGSRLPGIFFSCPRRWHFRPEDKVDVAFTPQINEYWDNRSVQLVVSDVREMVTPAQFDRGVYHKYRRGEELTPMEARSLIPSRREFEALWRCIKARAPLTMESPNRLTRQVARALDQPESYGRTMIALEVFKERGLMDCSSMHGKLNISLRAVAGKVDLEESPVLMSLRAAAGS